MFWKVRATPSAAMSLGFLWVMSWPSSSDAAGVGLVEARDHVEQRRLAGAVGADDGQDAAARHVERYVLAGRDAAELLRHTLDHKLVVALWRQCAPGRRPRHDPSLLKVLFSFR